MLSQIQDALTKIGEKTVIENLGVQNRNASLNDKDLYKVMLMDKLDNVMARDVGVNESIYNSLLQRLETAKITQRLQSSKEGTKYTIIEEARIPVTPISPNKMLVAMMGFVLGLGLGVALLFIMEFLDTSFLDVQEAAAYLGTPLLGSISKINTVEAIQENRHREIHLLFWMAIAGVLLISLSILTASLKGAA
jgi:capsular polysaccharide biosynthesis protein